MKRLFLLTGLMLGIFFNSSAQVPVETTPQISAEVADEAIRQGNWMVGGNLASLSQNFDTETFQVNLVPNTAYFISDHAAVGIQGILGLTAYDGGTNYTYAIAPMLRYYFGQGGTTSGRWFTEANVGFAGSSLKDSDTDENFSFLFGIEVGYAHFVARNVALEGVLAFTDTEANLQQAGLLSGLGVGLGFQIYLPGRERYR